MYLTGMPRKRGYYWFKSIKMEDPQIAFFTPGRGPGDETWFNLITRYEDTPHEDDIYWDIPLTPPSDYCMGGSYSVYGRDKDPQLEEIHED